MIGEPEQAIINDPRSIRSSYNLNHYDILYVDQADGSVLAVYDRQLIDTVLVEHGSRFGS